MLELKNKLEIQDLIRELEENKLKYSMLTNKCLRNGELSNLEITIEVKDND